MALTLGKLLSGVKSTYNMQLIAGQGGLVNMVKWVHMVEDRAVPAFLHGNELIFTTGIAQIGTEWLLEFVKNLNNQKASGLVLNIGPYIKNVPREVIQFCEEEKFPLFTVPWEVRLVDITYDFCHRIVFSEEIEMSLASAFKNALFMPGSVESYKPVLERRGFHTDSAYCLAAMSLYTEGRSLSEEELRTFKLRVQYVFEKTGARFSIFFYEKILLIIFQDFADGRIPECFEEIVNLWWQEGSDAKIHGGSSPVQDGLDKLKNCYSKAVAAMNVAHKQGKAYLSYKELGLYKLFVSVEDTGALKEIYSENLGKLEDFDRQNSTDYLETLRFYLNSDGSVQEVALKTGVHRNTVNYKIKKIREILQCEMTPEEKLKMAMGFYIRDFL